MSTVPAARTAEDWKARCQQLGEEHDEFRRQSVRNETRVQKSILRLAVTCTGVDPEFDRQILGLKNTLRAGTDEGARRRAFDAVLEAMTGLSGRRPPSAAPAAAAHRPLVALLDRLQVPDAQLFELRQVRARLEQDGADLDASIDRVAGLINDARRSGADDAFQILLERLRLKGDFGIRLIELRRQGSQARENAARMAVVDAVVALVQDAFERPAGRLDTEALTLAEISSVLAQLLDWMSLPPAAHARAEGVRRQLAAGVAEAELTGVLKEIAGIATDVRRDLERELTDVESFLQGLTATLTTFDAELRLASGAHRDSALGAAQLRDDMNAQIQALRADADGADALEGLRRFIENRCASIGATIDAFVAGAERRHGEAGRRVEELESELHAMRARIDDLGAALATEQQRARIDALTGLPNRRALDQRLAAEHARWLRHGGSLCVAILDLDHFKRVNDTYGHPAGDKVLSSVAELCRTRLRAGDFLARAGGEEFVLILPQTGLDGARAATDTLRREVERCRFHYRGTPVPVTFSIGLAELEPGESPVAALERADRQLYRAKAAGRNRVCDERDPH
ncbi:MAG: diguanylate cyclase [Gammaproteobacteria bacterium]